MLDAIYLAAILALFALVGLIARGVERIDHSARASAPRDAVSREGRA